MNTRAEIISKTLARQAQTLLASVSISEYSTLVKSTYKRKDLLGAYNSKGLGSMMATASDRHGYWS